MATGQVGSYPVLGGLRLQHDVRGRWVSTSTQWCTVTADTYDGGSTEATDRGRFWLRAIGAVLLFPTTPLPAGAWRVVAGASGHRVEIGFRVR